MYKKRNKIKLDKKALEIVQKYLLKLSSLGIAVKEAYIFGSQVNGSAHKWSDLDLGIVSKDFKGDIHAERVKLMNIRDGETDVIEPHPFIPEDFADSYNLLAGEIKRTGVRVGF